MKADKAIDFTNILHRRYTTTQISKSLGISMESLRDWLLRGYVTPSVPSEGQGKKALFDFIDILGIRLFQELVLIGFSREVGGKIYKGFMEIVEAQGEDIFRRHIIPAQGIFKVYRGEVFATYASLMVIGGLAEHLMESAEILKREGKEICGVHKGLVEMNEAQRDEWLNPDAKTVELPVGADWDFFHLVNIRRLHDDVKERLVHA